MTWIDLLIFPLLVIGIYFYSKQGVLAALITMLLMLGYTKLIVTMYHPPVLDGVPQTSWNFFIMYLAGAALVIGLCFAVTAYSSFNPGDDILESVGGGVFGLIVAWCLCYGLVHGLLLAYGTASDVGAAVTNSLLADQVYFFKMFKSGADVMEGLGNYD